MAKLIKIDTKSKKISEYINSDEIRSILYSIENDLDRPNDLVNWKKMYLNSKILYHRLGEVMEALEPTIQDGNTNTKT
jgi:translation initiation factor 2 alpha subunit (eIF-2alpha)